MHNLKIWGRNIELKVEYDCFDNENLLPNQKQSFDAFIDSSDVIESSKKQLEHFILNDKMANIQEDSIDNIFRYVIPKTIYVIRSSENREIALLCDYRFDIEHGIAILFKNEKFVKICSQDEVL